MAAHCFRDECSLPGHAHRQPANRIQLRNPYTSGLTATFLGRIPEAARTLDLPLLHTSRPHFMPPCLIMPTHTFILPITAPREAVSTVSPAVLPHVVECSFMPSHPHCLVSSCTGGVSTGSIFSLDLHACEVVQAFTLPAGTWIVRQPSCPPPASSSFSRRSPVSSCPCHGASVSHAPLEHRAASRVSCASMHRDPTCPLLFLGTSEGDVLAYDLRFSGGSFCPRPCLSLRGTHDGPISGVRAASGPLLPAHLFFTSGLTDGWIKLFDLRFPLHYTACSGERESSGLVSRGSAPYPVEAVQPNPSLAFCGKNCPSKQAGHKSGNMACLEADDAASAASSSSRTNTSWHSSCCRGSGGITGIDLSPDGALLAAAHVRMRSLHSAEAGLGASSQSRDPRPLTQTAALACLFADTPQPVPPGLDHTSSAQEREHQSTNCMLTAEHNHDDEDGERELDSSAENRRELLNRGSPRARGTRIDPGCLEGETVILSVSEGLRVLKTLAVADACAFMGVEFSANGKYLLQTGGTINGTACMLCQSCRCCCCCSDVASTDSLHTAEAVNTSVCYPLSTSRVPLPRRISHAQRTQMIAGLAAEGGRCVATRSRKDNRGQEKEECERNAKTQATYHRRRLRASAQRQSHRAQIVNLVQCNRVAVLKSPADGALAFADTSLIKHAFVTQSVDESHAPRMHTTSLKAADGWQATNHQTWHLESDESASLSRDVEDEYDSFTLKIHASSSLTQNSVSGHPSELNGLEENNVDLDHHALPLDLSLYSPSSRLMDRRRHVFWEREARFFSSHFGSKNLKRNSMSQRTGRPSEINEKRLRRLRERAPTPEQGVSESDSWSARRKSLSAATAPVTVCSPRSGLLEQTKEKAVPQRKRRRLPLPRCSSQSSLFLTACGVLHPQWGRHDCFSQQFLCTFWGGLVAGVGGSQVYPGLKLWHSATGVVLTCAEGPLATRHAVRCVRGHPDLSLGILATGGSLPFHSAAAAVASTASHHLTKRSSAPPPSNFQRPYSGKYDKRNRLRLSKGSCAAVTLWSLEHRDTVLERALKTSDDSVLFKGRLRVDPSDEE